MSNKGKYYMTTAIAYTSGKPHIETLMRSYLQMRSQDTREQKAMTYTSRQERMSMVRRFRKKRKQQESLRRNM